MSQSFSDLCTSAIAKACSPACVGLDPVLESLPAVVRARHHDPLGAIQEFCHGVLGSITGVVPAVKFQSACFERYGSRGVALLEELAGDAGRRGLVVVYDAKRGDISTTGAHYAACAKRLGAHAITASGYLGRSGVQPYVDAGLGVFVLVRTSNPDSDAVQSNTLRDGRSVAELMGDLVAEWGSSSVGSSGLSNVGAVVGATKSADARELRRRMPNQIFLVPGFGAQGGTADDIRGMLRPGADLPRCGVLVTASRSVLYSAGGEDWKAAIRAAAEKLAIEIRNVVS